MGEQITGRDPQGDFLGTRFENGLEITGRVESTVGVRWQITCSKCGAVGQTITQKQMAVGEIPKCGNSGCGIDSRPERRTATIFSDAGGGSVRDRMARQAEAAALAAMEEGN